MAKTALITGGTAGIGHELARCFARDGHDIIVVARSAERLDKVCSVLHDKFKVKATPLPADLSDPAAPQQIVDRLQSDGIEIEYLVNNAGFGTNGPFYKTELATELEMIQVNVSSLVAMTHLFLQPMVARKSGRIMNVASTAAFQPGPHMAIYCATKAFVLSFTEAIDIELKGTGVTVTGLCPGATTTEFQARAKMDKVPLVNGMVPMMTAKAVAEQGYRAMMAGKTVCVTGAMNKLGAMSIRITPRKMAATIAGKMMAAK